MSESLLGANHPNHGDDFPRKAAASAIKREPNLGQRTPPILRITTGHEECRSFEQNSLDITRNSPTPAQHPLRNDYCNNAILVLEQTQTTELHQLGAMLCRQQGNTIGGSGPAIVTPPSSPQAQIKIEGKDRILLASSPKPDHRADLKVANDSLQELNYNMTECSAFSFIATKNESFVWHVGRPNAIHFQKQSTALGGSRAMQQFALFLRRCFYPERDVIKWN